MNGMRIEIAINNVSTANESVLGRPVGSGEAEAGRAGEHGDNGQAIRGVRRSMSERRRRKMWARPRQAAGGNIMRGLWARPRQYRNAGLTATHVG